MSPFPIIKNIFKDSNLGTLKWNKNLNKLAGDDLVNISNNLSQSNKILLVARIYNLLKYWQLINNFSNSEISSFFKRPSLRYLSFGQFW